MFIVSVLLTEPFAAGVAEDGFIPQVGANAGAGCTEQVKFTVLLNPFTEVSVTVAVVLPPGATELEVGAEADSEKVGAMKLALTD